MDETWKDYEFLDRAPVIDSIFYPRGDYYEIPDSDRAIAVYLWVEEGVTISCRFYFADKSYPNVLYFHGNGELASEYEDIGLIYNSAGINLFVTDYRGYGRSGGRPTVTNMMKDSYPLLDGFKQLLKEKGFIGASFIMGRSLGSAPALELAAAHPEAFKGLIIESGFCDFSALLIRLGIGQGKSHPSPGLERVRRITIPALILHGEDDSIVPLSQGEMIYANLGSTEKKMVSIPDADHNSIFAEGMGLYMRELRDFINRYK